MKHFLQFLVLSVVFSACLDDAECINLVNNTAGITFKNMDGTAHTIAFTSVQADGASEKFQVATTASKVLVPLDITRDTTRLKFVTTAATYDVVLAYITKSQFVSEDCGYRYVLSDLHVVSHPFDSLQIVSPNPGNSSTVRNIDFFIR